MIILGLHFGHDASVCVIRDGEVASYILKERFTRVKHAATLNRDTVNMALQEAGVAPDEIDYCAISSTQLVEPIFDDEDYLRITPQPLRGETFNSQFYTLTKEHNLEVDQLGSASLTSIVFGDREDNPYQYDVWTKMFPEHKAMRKEDIHQYHWFDTYINFPHWEQGLTLEEIGDMRIDEDLRTTGLNRSFHYPATLTLEGRDIPASYIHHHLAHAAASFYLSGFEDAAILTHDGYANGHLYHSGMLYFAEGTKIHPIGPHHLAIGGLYDYVGTYLGLGDVGSAGKLMGLAAYGKPRFFDPTFVGNAIDHKKTGINFVQAWLQHCETRARHMDYDFSHYRNPEHITAQINVDLAASTQKLFEEIRLKTVIVLMEFLQRNEIKTANLCLSGGTALNCPSNSQIASQGPFENVYVEPCCDDSGIAIGAALALYHNVLDQPRTLTIKSASPYLGKAREDNEIKAALESCEGIAYEACDSPGRTAAEELVNNNVICWFEGKSETGPRALGARSIIANPTHKENWERVNRIKRRELWRPFAPVVLESEALEWFADVPSPSPYMLFNAQVRSQKIPAVTHVDNTARIQTVDEDNGEYYQVLKYFYEMTGVPVLLNTSFNGPGEPIVESPEHALNFLLTTDIHALYIGGYRVTRAPA